MRIIARKTLKDFWEAGHGEAEQPLKSWFAEVERAEWSTMAQVRARFAHASVVDSERVVFNIGGKKYRLVAKIWFPGKTVWVKSVGTHAEYDDLDVRSL